MKKVYTILLTIFSFSALHLASQDIADLETFENAMKPGTELKYDVTVKDKKFNLIITLKKVGDGMAFSWKTTDPDNKSGSVTMSAGALSAATAFAHVFNGGDAKLDKETCLILSKQVFTGINANAQASLKINGAADTVTVMSNAVDNFGFSVNGNMVSLEVWELQGGDPKYTIGVLESSKFPLIYKLDIGWSMILTEIKSQ
jgi:hypothetical protein